MKLKFSTALFIFISMVFGSDSAQAAQAEAQLFVPWSAIKARLQSSVREQNGKFQTNVADQKISVSDLEAFISGIKIETQSTEVLLSLNELGVRAQFSKIPLSIHIDKISIDQIIEREVAGAKVRVHVQAKCGPILLSQNSASADSEFTANWDIDSAAMELVKLDVNWDPSSWLISNFSCEGPQGIDSVLQKQISEQFSNPVQFRDSVADVLGRAVQDKFSEGMKFLKSPFLAAVDSKVQYTVSKLNPTSLGIVADLILSDSTKLIPTSLKLPTPAVLSNLSQTAPSILSKIELIEFLVDQRIQTEPSYQTLNLQGVKSFNDLMRSRFLQFFVWPDLRKYPKDSPFFLRLATPRNLKLNRTADGKISVPISIQGFVQSYRDQSWWNYISISGSAVANVSITLSNGALTYQTSLASAATKMDYTPEYFGRFKPGSGFPKSKISSAVLKSSFAGRLNLADLDFGIGGKFKPAELRWLENGMLVVPLKAVVD